MAWSFRRSINLGPLRINASKLGLGYSVGVPGFRVGKDARGRSYTSASIPGTGIYNRTYLKGQPANRVPAVKVGAQAPMVVLNAAGRLLVQGLPYCAAAAAIYYLLSLVLHLL